MNHNEHRVTLNNGVKMPWIGLGVWTPERDDATEPVKFALQSGYRHIDTAAGYRNEEQVGRAIRESGVPREDIFVTTKVYPPEHEIYESTLRAFRESLDKLQMDYVDLYLVHWPVDGRTLETWRALETIYKEGKARAIGVSNFEPHHLAELLPQAEVVPAVNQVEYHPHLVRPAIAEASRRAGIQMEAWSPLMKGALDGEPVLAEIAAAHGKTAAQVVLRWNIQTGYVTIPKSFNRQRILSNAEVFDFELSPEEIERISALDRNEHLPPPDMSKYK